MGRDGEREGVTARVSFSFGCCGRGPCTVESVVDASVPGVVGVGEGLSVGGDGKGEAADTGVSMDG